MSNKNWSKLVLLASLASCSISLGSPVAEAEAVSRYGRGYSGLRGFGLSSRTPRVYSGQYNRGYGGRYNSDRHGYHLHRFHKKHHQHILSRPQSQHKVVQDEVDRFIPANPKQADQRIFIDENLAPSPGNMQQGLSPSFSVEIDFNDDATYIISEPFTNSVDNIEPVQQSEREDLVFNIPPVPVENLNPVTVRTAIVAAVSSVSATQQRLIDQILRQEQQQAQEIDNILNTSNEVQEPSQNTSIPDPTNSPSPIPTPSIATFQFPPRISAESPAPPPVQQPLSSNLPSPVLPHAIPAVPSRPVLADNTVQLNSVQPVQPVQQSSFIPMPVPAVPGLSY